MAHPAEGHGFRLLGHLEVPGGGQVVVRGRYAYVGHMQGPAGTSIVDVADPRQPRVVAQLTVPPSVHSHKVRVRDSLMLVNLEPIPGAAVAVEDSPGRDEVPLGLKVYDIARPDQPREVGFWPSGRRGVHRFDIDDRYAYLGASIDGYRGKIVVVLDLADPARPQEASRWWMPGQWEAGGEEPPWQGQILGVHHPLRRGDRLYVGCNERGLAIVEVAEISRPRLVSSLCWNPPYAFYTHTVLPVPHPVRGRRVLVVADESHTREVWEDPTSALWLVDITAEEHPVPIATFQVPQGDFAQRRVRFGCHQPHEAVGSDNLVYVCWFGGGLRVVDISDPYRPQEVAYYIPAAPPGQAAAQTNDVFRDERGLVYLIDREAGLDILEPTFRRL